MNEQPVDLRGHPNPEAALAQLLGQSQAESALGAAAAEMAERLFATYERHVQHCPECTIEDDCNSSMWFATNVWAMFLCGAIEAGMDASALSVLVRTSTDMWYHNLLARARTLWQTKHDTPSALLAAIMDIAPSRLTSVERPWVYIPFATKRTATIQDKARKKTS